MPHINLQRLAHEISRIPPGDYYSIPNLALRGIAPTFGLASGYDWKPADRVMDNIVGSAFEFRYVIDGPSDVVTFIRLASPLTDGRRSYVSPDRREHYFVGADGFWHPKTNAV